MPPSFILAWASAIAQFEGFNSSGSRPQRNNNPGDLKYAGQPGATGQDAQGFAVFPDAATGYQALYNQLQAYVNDYPQYSILQIMAHYLGQGSAPAINSQGNAFTYAQAVATAIGVDTSTTLAELAAGVTSPAAPAPTIADDSADTSDSGGGWTPSGGELAVIAIAGGLMLWAALRIG